MYLAAKRAEAEAIINEATIANLAGIGYAFPGPRLRPLVQEDDFSTINHICLDPGYIKILLYLIHPYNIMIRRSPYLQNQSRKIQNLKPTKNIKSFDESTSNYRDYSTIKIKTTPEWFDDPCDEQDKESKVGRWCSLSNTYCIHSYENLHETCNEQRNAL